MMKKFLTSREAADYLAISEDEIKVLSDNKRIPVYRIGGIYTRFKVDDLETYRRKGVTRDNRKHAENTIDSIRDFLYFNDFYIFSAIAVIVILYFIFK
ncbi:MAG: helix-turn-helix domain-containing protein [Candidatus Omnitrophota bacterium]